MADDLEEVRQRFVAEMSGYIGPITAAADKTKGFKDAAEEAGYASRFFGDAMKKARDDALELKAAEDVLGFSIAETNNLEKKARDRLIELGFAEREAAAGARKLAEAQTAADAAFELGGLAKLMNSAGGIGQILSAVGGLAGGIGIVFVIAGAVTEVAALVSGFAAAAAGVVAFGALAYPALKSISSGYSAVATAQGKVHTAQIALTDAQAAYNRSPTKANLAAEQTALKNLEKAQQGVKDQWRQMDPAQRAAVKGIEQLKNSYDAMAKAFEPDAFKVFDQGLRIANELLPQLKPLADAATPAIEGLLGKLEKFFAPAQTPGRASALGDIAAHIHDISQYPPPTGWQQFIASFKQLEGPAITAIGTNLGHIAGQMGNLLTKFSAKDVVNAINIAFKILSVTIGGFTRIVDNAMNWWDQLTAGIKAAHNWFDTARHAVAEFGHGIRMTFDEVMHTAEHDWDTVRHDTAAAWDTVRHDVAHAADVVRADVIRVGHDIETHWDHAWSTVVNFTKGIPGKILHALGDVGQLLVNAGKQVIDGLWNGMKAAWGAVTGWLSSLGGWISSLKGPVDKDAVLLVPHGMAIMHGLAQGLKAGLPEVRQQLGLTTSVLAGLGGAGLYGPHLGAGGLSGPGVHVTVPVTLAPGMSFLTSPQLLQQLQQVVQEAILRYLHMNTANGLG